MQLTSRFRIRQIKSIIEFLNENNVGRISTIDTEGFPQIIPMNFVCAPDFSGNFNLNNGDGGGGDVGKAASTAAAAASHQKGELEGKGGKKGEGQGLRSCTKAFSGSHAIYMHSHHRGEKLDNMRRNPKVGFEADREVCFLPSYYFHPTDASFADTLYISVVIKGKASIVTDNGEKAFAMNAMMQKYQREGRYTPLTEGMKSIQHLTVLKINPETITGKYKIGQEWTAKYRSNIARRIIEREGTARAKEILGQMKIKILADGKLETTDPVEL
jgi:nitroimidazol reductase NimA-like FMN-containing flavoprotein (pyridoxamine 5'-phosphate oxidase superfamily)